MYLIIQVNYQQLQSKVIPIAQLLNVAHVLDCGKLGVRAALVNHLIANTNVFGELAEARIINNSQPLLLRDDGQQELISYWMNWYEVFSWTSPHGIVENKPVAENRVVDANFHRSFVNHLRHLD